MKIKPTRLEPTYSFLSRLLMQKKHERRHVYAIAGACSGLVSAVVVCPLDVVKVRLQYQTVDHYYKGTLGTLARIAREEGLRGLFSGLSPTGIKIGSERMIIPWMCVTSIKKRMAK